MPPRKHQVWSLDNFDDGYPVKDHSGNMRMEVYVPNHPRADYRGYITRAIVAYEMYTGEKTSSEEHIHHINSNTMDDSQGNLEKVDPGSHVAFHISQSRPVKIDYSTCEQCNKLFTYRLAANTKARFCSSQCSDLSMLNRTQCKNGHPLTGPESFRYFKRPDKTEGRQCLTCRREYTGRKSAMAHGEAYIPAAQRTNKCSRCGHQWIARTMSKPSHCASCKTPLVLVETHAH